MMYGNICILKNSSDNVGFEKFVEPMGEISLPEDFHNADIYFHYIHWWFACSAYPCMLMSGPRRKR